MTDINPELRARIEQQRLERLENSPSGRYRPELDRHKPASMQPGSDLLPLFWIGLFVVVIGLSWYFGSGL